MSDLYGVPGDGAAGNDAIEQLRGQIQELRECRSSTLASRAVGEEHQTRSILRSMWESRPTRVATSRPLHVFCMKQAVILLDLQIKSLLC